MNKKKIQFTNKTRKCEFKTATFLIFYNFVLQPVPNEAFEVNPLGAAKFHVSNSNENFCNCSLMKFKKLLFVGIFENCFIQLITA